MISSRLGLKMGHFWVFFNHYDLIVEGELTHPFLKIEVLESSDSVILRRCGGWRRQNGNDIQMLLPEIYLSLAALGEHKRGARIPTLTTES